MSFLRLWQVGLVASMALLFTNCASFFSDSSDRIHIESVPSGAQVYHEGRLMGTTPLNADVHRTSDISYLVFKKNGYTTKNVMLERGLAGASLLNLFFLPTTFGVTSWGIDYASGKMFKYANRAYVAELSPAGTSSLDEPSPLGFTLANYQGLRDELARGQFQLWGSMCPTLRLDSAGCRGFLRSVQSKRERLLAQTDPVEMYRMIR